MECTYNIQPATGRFVRREHCAIDAGLLSDIGRAVGHQIRIRRSAEEFALYTVTAALQNSDGAAIRMSPAGLRRLGARSACAASVEPFAAHPTMDDQAARAAGEFVERTDDRTGDLLFLAPHGGEMERFTAEQAAHAAALLGASSWRCLGWRPGGSASARWHITSTDLHEASFPGLASLARRRFRLAVSFHGYSRERFLVGGLGPRELRERIRAAVERAGGLPADLAEIGEEAGGSRPRNIVNRLAPGGGIQIEQPREARMTRWREIAAAVAAVLR